MNRTVLIVLAALGLSGLCLVGGCLAVGLTLADDPGVEATPPLAADSEPAEGAHAGRYQCQATGMFNSCVGPNRCTYRTASGYGSGDDRFQAAEMARLACQGQVMAMGGAAVCVVTCTP